jgi:hypothetical protein
MEIAQTGGIELIAYLIDVADLRNATAMQVPALNRWTGEVAAAPLAEVTETIPMTPNQDEMQIVARPVEGDFAPVALTVNRKRFEAVAKEVTPRAVDLVMAVATGQATSS